MFEEAEIKRFILKEGLKSLKDKVVKEIFLSIVLDGEELAVLSASPAKLKELAVGYLYSENIISSLDDIEKLVLNEERSGVYIKTKNVQLPEKYSKKRVTSGCGKGVSFFDLEKAQPVESVFKISAKEILDAMADFQRRSDVFRETGGVHSAALCESSKIDVFAEDIGRHNAVDKIIGEVLLTGKKFYGKYLMTSGRISSEILGKASQIKIPLIVSRSAPTDVAIRLARKLKITLAGFVRGTRMNIYSEEERILF
jgi:FdhD protein